jgi:hypothetical protein
MVPEAYVGKRIGYSLYTFNNIYEVLDAHGKQLPLVIKICWEPFGVPLGMSLRALDHEWVMYQNMKVTARRFMR